MSHNASSMNRRALLGTAAATATLTLGACATAGRPRPHSSPPRLPGPRSRYFPNHSLLTHDGREVRFYDDLMWRKIVVINMFYAQCTGICPTTTTNLVAVQKALGDLVGRDIHMYSLTLKPEEDSPDVLAHYAKMHGIGPGWTLLTGHPDDMEDLRRRLGFVDPDPAADADKNQHIGVIRFGNEQLDRWGACPSLLRPELTARYIQWMLPVRRRSWPLSTVTSAAAE